MRDAPEHSLHRHYTFVSKLRVLISNREAARFLAIGLAMSVLFGSALWLLTVKGYGNSGHLYAITTYLWMFAMSLDDSPALVEQFAKLRDIGQRVAV